MIFQVQSRQAEADRIAWETSHGELRDLFARSQRVPLSNEENEREQQGDEHEADSREADDAGVQWSVDGKDGRFLTRDRVPLSVIADIVWGWRAKKIGKDRTWTVEYLIGAFRPSGQGNHPWYLYFRAPDGTKSIWRMYRGGRANTTPTVREVSAEIDHS
ncbi:hypothetical protein [Gordonia alkanivorans]|nr:hypothetical protein [Gordonia alkanivorans]MDH3006250.1 hypothetical protein [Gordonia alkanivorans]MDH3014007.1 hypothetical protein [Gordonia alkanivorans]MDH3042686.1 hypothetical protein [Gordonia alkanivorans]